MVPPVRSGFDCRPRPGDLAFDISIVTLGVDELIDAASGAGARVVKPPQRADWGGYPAYFADLGGHLWEVAYNPYFDVA